MLTHWRQCACVYFLYAITDQKQTEGAWSLRCWKRTTTLTQTQTLFTRCPNFTGSRNHWVKIVREATFCNLNGRCFDTFSHHFRVARCPVLEWLLVMVSRPSGLLLSCLVKPTGSFVTGIPAYCMARATTSFNAWCLIILLRAACSHEVPGHPPMIRIDKNVVRIVSNSI